MMNRKHYLRDRPMIRCLKKHADHWKGYTSRRSVILTKLLLYIFFFFFFFFLWVDSFNRGNSSWSDIEYFVNSYSSILQFDKQELNLQSEQLVDFQTLFEKELPNGALADAIIKELEDEDGKTQN